MIIFYYLDSISVPYYNYKVYVNNDVFNLEIDLINKYPNYKYVEHNHNNKYWYYVLSKSNDDKHFKGEIIKQDMSKLKVNNPKYILHEGNEYKIAEQMDLDKYYYFMNIENDNSKLFSYIYNYLIFYYKNEYKGKKEKDIKIKNRYNETLL